RCPIEHRRLAAGRSGRLLGPMGPLPGIAALAGLPGRGADRLAPGGGGLMESVYTTWGWLPHDDGHAPASFFSHMVYMGAALTGQGGLTGVKAAPGSGPGRPFWGVSQPQEGGEALRHLLENPAARARAARNIARHCREGGYAGCSLSIQAPLPHQRDNLSALVEETAWQLRQAGLALAVEVLGRTRDPQNAGSAGADGGPSPADWADLYDYMTLGVYTDYFI